MKHISELKDFGVNKKCIIIGNGNSSAIFNYSNINVDDYIIFGINKAEIELPYHTVFYYDKDMGEYYANNDKGQFKLVGFKHKSIDHTSHNCDYYYTFTDIVFGDSGLHVLYLADKIYRFKEIYLIGFDYRLKDNSISYFNSLDLKEQERKHKFLIHSIRVVQKYHSIEWDNEIYNVNENSILDAFPYKQIKEL